MFLPQAEAPRPGPENTGVGSLPEPAVDLQPPAGGRAKLCCRGDYGALRWVRRGTSQLEDHVLTSLKIAEVSEDSAFKLASNFPQKDVVN